ncbi:hypothetical protein D0Y50_08030 [Salinimonas sediminis]|uniref:Uncharacterized protein n=1 Tax=Salinimonas sediminis TaxID=2303538 RepID=A0A346NLA8_9ALTE|nr:hypothetical protein D0Y50_08030 [Salinimonas sediminis]
MAERIGLALGNGLPASQGLKPEGAMVDSACAACGTLHWLSIEQMASDCNARLLPRSPEQLEITCAKNLLACFFIQYYCIDILYG